MSNTDNPYAEGCAWIDDGYVPIGEARIPLIDTGFTRSDLTHDVVAVWKGKFFRLEDHLERFESGWTLLRMNPPHDKDDIRKILIECVRRAQLQDAYVQMIMTRGVPLPGVRDPRMLQNRFYAFAIPYIWIFQPDQQEIGCHLVISTQTIRIPAKAVNPTIKNFHWGDLVRGLFEAYDRGGQTVLLEDGDGMVTEGPGFNVFACHDGVVRTPREGVLLGITRRTAIELATEQGIQVQEESFRSEVLRSSDEVFLTSTAGGIMPVTIIDGQPVGDGKPGPITLRLRDRYWLAHDEKRWTTVVE